MNLSYLNNELAQSFILHFGEMGSNWGINRTVGQVYGLLYISNKPLNAEQICDALNFSRSNVSVAIKELQAWKLVKMNHQPNDRRDYFSALDDDIEIIRNLIEQKHKREVEPTLTMLRGLILKNTNSEEEVKFQEKIKKICNLIEGMTDWYQAMQKIENQQLIKLIKMSGKILKFKNFININILTKNNNENNE